MEEGGVDAGARAGTNVECQVLGIKVVVCAPCHGTIVDRYGVVGQCPRGLAYSKGAWVCLEPKCSLLG